MFFDSPTQMPTVNPSLSPSTSPTTRTHQLSAVFLFLCCTFMSLEHFMLQTHCKADPKSDDATVRDVPSGCYEFQRVYSADNGE